MDRWEGSVDLAAGYSTPCSLHEKGWSGVLWWGGAEQSREDHQCSHPHSNNVHMGTHSAELYGKLRVSSKKDENANNVSAVDIKRFRVILVHIFMPTKITYYNLCLVLPLMWDDVVRKLVSLNYCNFQDRTGWRFLGARSDRMIILVKFTVVLCLCNVLSLIHIADPFLLVRPNLLLTGLTLNVLGYTGLHCQVPQFFYEFRSGWSY